MSDEDKPFAIEIAKQGRAACKKCKQNCNAKELRIAKLISNPFGDGKMKAWHHLDCLFEVFQKQRVTTKRIEDPEEDISGWDLLSAEDKKQVLEKIDESNKFFETKFGIKITPKKPKSPAKDKEDTQIDQPGQAYNCGKSKRDDNSFKKFRALVADITNESSYLKKTEIVNNFFSKGKDASGFNGNVVMWCRLLLPAIVRRIYNLQSKQLIKLFSKIFNTDQDEMIEDLEKGDIGLTIQEFFEKSNGVKPSKKSRLTLQEVDEWLEELTKLTKEDEQINHLTKITKKCTSNDLKMIIRLIKHDLRMNAGAKHILEGIHPNAYSAYQSLRDIETVINRCLEKDADSKATIRVLTPVLPMLAEACKSVEQAMKKCPNGMYSEIKYDGERVQLHKQGTDFMYFSRSLKPVLRHKVAHFKKFIPDAFPHGEDLILDSEILMIDTQTGKPLPFGTLGIHKKSEFKDASVCLFVFDCIYYNGEILTDKPLKFRKKILRENMTEIPNHIVFSEMEEIHNPKDLSKMIAKVLKLGLEGLVLKDINSIYEPGKRHWLKVKKDYLFDGAMADSADLIVLGAWYGTGKKGGMMSVFLMGCYSKISDKFCTVTKVHTGHDDKTLERLQNELDMIKISGDINKVPNWLYCTKTMVPDYVARDPRKQPIWEITGAEFTQQHDVHTANGISIRFPRVTKIRDDKTWETATSLSELKQLFQNSKEHTDVSLLMKGIKHDNSESDSEEPDEEAGPSTSKRMKLEDSPKHSIKNFLTKGKNESKVRVKLKNPLPKYFSGTTIGVVDEVREKKPDLVRYFIAFDGKIDNKKLDYYVHMNNSCKDENSGGSNVKHVTWEWLQKCIVSERICDYRKFVVKLEPI